MTENVEYIEDHQLARLRAKARHQVCLVHEVHNVNFQQVTIKELVESASLFNLPIDVFCMKMDMIIDSMTKSGDLTPKK